jgi:D-glycero-D-manno-heptose 1,7-bisphosphate phosphatase
MWPTYPCCSEGPQAPEYYGPDLKMPRERLVVLDRDGVINEDRDDYVRSPEQWIPIPGSLEALGQLTRSGFRIVVVTNQSGLARGLFDQGILNAMHRKLYEVAGLHGGRIEMLLFCPHGPWEYCCCRKPKPALFETIEERFGFPLQGIPFIGDSASDVASAKIFGMRPILVKTGKGQRTLCDHRLDLTGVMIGDDLAAIATVLINHWGDL